MPSTILNGKNVPLNTKAGTVPDLSGALLDWFQPMVFGIVTKRTVGFQAVETQEQLSFRGVIQPLKDRELAMKPEGQQAWTWLLLHADPSLNLQVDSVVTYLGTQTRIMSKRDYSLYGYVEYNLVQDWTGSGPTVVTP